MCWQPTFVVVSQSRASFSRVVGREQENDGDMDAGAVAHEDMAKHRERLKCHEVMEQGLWDTAP